MQMCEEIKNAQNVVPRAIVLSYIVNGLIGFAIVLAALLRSGDLDSLLDPPSGYAFISIFSEALHSVAGATVLVCIITVMQIVAAVSNFAAASRMLWSFARDRGVPGWRIVQKVCNLSYLSAHRNLISFRSTSGPHYLSMPF